MVPAWATVVIALGASAIGAAAGIFGAYISLRIARLSLDHQASEAWRTRRLEAAEDYSASWAAEISGVGVLRGVISDRGDPAKAVEALVEKHSDGGAKLMRVGLLFGADSPAREAARESLSQLNQASLVLERFSGSAHATDRADAEREEAIRACNEHMSLSQAAHREFIRIAHTELLRGEAGSPRRRPVRADLRAEEQPEAL